MNTLLQRLTAPGWAEFAQTSIHVVFMVALAWGALWLARRAIPLLRDQMTRRIDDQEQSRRIATLERALRYGTSVVIVGVSGMLILSELGISIAPLLAAAGVAGIAVGFGAQSLVKDYFTGIIMLIEDQVRQGDVVEAGGKSGLVEEVTLRFVRLRDYDGNVHFVPNGTISTVTNRSRSFAFAVIDAGIAYREEIDQAIELMRQVGCEMRDDASFGPKILEDLDVAGVESWADSAVILRCRFKVIPLEQWHVRREFLKRLKQRFDEHGVEIPYPHLTIYAGEPKERHAPAFRVRREPDDAPVTHRH